jgi:hypothetical protein
MAPPVPANWGYGLEYLGDVEFEKAQAEREAKVSKEGITSDSEVSKEAEFEGDKKVSDNGNGCVVWLSYINDSFDEEVFSAYQECMKEQAEKGAQVGR